MKAAKFLAAAALLLTTTSIAGAQQPVKIGFVGELSGPAATLGQDQYDAFMMVVERNGGRLGGVPVQVLKEDSQLKPEVANQVVQRLIERERVPIITGMTFSNIIMAVYKTIADREVFLIGTNAGPSPLAGQQCSAYRFIMSLQGDQLAEAAGQYSNDKGYKKMYLMASNYQAGKDLVAGFKRTFKGQVVEEVYTPLNQVDFSVELTQLAAAKPDAVYAFYPGGTGIAFGRQYQQMGLQKTFPLINSGVDGTVVQALGDVGLGTVMVSSWAPDTDTPENKKFVEEFEAKFNRIPSMTAAFSYDAAVLLDAAIAEVKGNVTDKAAFRAALKSAKFKSVRGDFTFGKNNFPVQNFYVQEVAKDAKGRIGLRTVATPLKAAVDSYARDCRLN